MQYRHATFLLLIMMFGTSILTVAVFQRRAAIEEFAEDEETIPFYEEHEIEDILGLQEGQYDVLDVDLDGDGILESVSLTVQKSAEYGSTRTLTVNGVHVDLKNTGNNPQPYFGIVDLDTTDTFQEIVLSDWGPSSDYTTVFYGWQQGGIVYLGATSDLWERMIFPGDGTVLADARAMVFDTWFYRETYRRVGTTIVLVPQEFYTRRDPAFVTMTGSLTLFVVPGGTTALAVLAPGDTGTILGCTSATLEADAWCKLVPADGIEGWFSVQDTSLDLFEGLSFAD